MKIHNVSIDGDLPRFGGRALIVNTNKGKFKTPQRALTSSEFQYKAKLPFEPPLNNKISEVVAQFSKSNWESFMNTNGSFNSRLRRMDFYTDKMSYTIRKFYPQIPLGIKIDDSAIKQLLELQRMSKADYISLPSLPLSIDDFAGLSSSFSEEVLSEKREPLIYIDMNLDPPIFKRRYLGLLKLAENDLIHSIGLIYRPIRRYVLNYKLLWQHRETEVLLQMSDIRREFTYASGTSTMHLLQKWGIDTFSVKIGRYVPSIPKGKDKKPPPPLPKDEILKRTKRFDHIPLAFRRYYTWMEHEGSLDCKCPICKDMGSDDFLSEYRGESESYPGETFNAANRLHEYYRSSDEFKKSRDYIKGRELEEYFKEKDGLRKSDVSIPGDISDWL